MDLEAVLARRPELALVDELAHTNAPGSRHARRWQDVEEILAAGIDVFTTLNVQHVESLHDVVTQITGVAVRETVPDSILERADEIELVDLPPEELLRRLAEGKVYVPEQAQRAMQSFFQKGNLIALRELALRRTAERVDVQGDEWREAHGVARPWGARERILVAVGPAPQVRRRRAGGRADGRGTEGAVDRAVGRDARVRSPLRGGSRARRGAPGARREPGRRDVVVRGERDGRRDPRRRATRGT